MPYVSLGKLLYLSEPQATDLKNEGAYSHLERFCFEGQMSRAWFLTHSRPLMHGDGFFLPVMLGFATDELLTAQGVWNRALGRHSGLRVVTIGRLLAPGHSVFRPFVDYAFFFPSLWMAEGTHQTSSWHGCANCWCHLSQRVTSEW